MGGWVQGVPLEYAQELCALLAHRYDWRRCEAELNSWPQFRTGLDGGADDTVDVHLIHARSPHQGACRWCCRTAGPVRWSSSWTSWTS